jgi:cell division protein FtsL
MPSMKITSSNKTLFIDLFLTIIFAAVLTIFAINANVNEDSLQQRIQQLELEIENKDDIICELLQLKLPPSKNIKPKRVKPDCIPCIKCPE